MKKLECINKRVITIIVKKGTIFNLKVNLLTEWIPSKSKFRTANVCFTFTE